MSRLPPPFNSRFPPTGLARRPATLRAGCLSHNNVKLFGARGDGRRSDVAALRRANASRSRRYLYVPVGVYRIDKSLVLTKPVIMGARRSAAALRLGWGLPRRS